jgi:hypothetical protein
MLERDFRVHVSFREDHREALEQPIVLPVPVGEFEQSRVDAQIVPSRIYIARDDDAQLIAAQGRLGSDAGKSGVANEIPEALGERMSPIGGKVQARTSLCWQLSARS